MKVNEQHRAAAAHQAIRRHGRVDAARQQARHAAAGAGRQAAGARRPCRRSRTRRPAACRRARSAPGRSRSTRQPFASLMRPPTSRSICGEVSGKRLSVRRAVTRNDSAADRRGRRGSPPPARRRRAGPRPAGEKYAMPNTCPQPIAHLRPRRSRRPARFRSVPSPSGSAATCRPASASCRLRTSIRMNHGRFLPLSASSL